MRAPKSVVENDSSLRRGAISAYMAEIGGKGGKAPKPTSAENGRLGGRPTEAERAERRSFYARLEEDGHKRPVSRSPYPLDQAKAKVRELLAGHKVERCTQTYLDPADESRAERGLETGLVARQRAWLEVDGKRLPSDVPTMDEIREALRD